MQDLDACRSVSGRALVLLAMAAIRGKIPDELETALRACDPVDLARSAQVHQVHTMVGHVFSRHAELDDAVPRDLKIFFLAMYSANQERLTEGLAQLKSIGSVLSAANIPAVVLKGGGDMLDPLHPDPAMRFVADLDILIPLEHLKHAERLLLGELGAVQPFEELNEGSELNWRGKRMPEHHLPKFTAENWHFPVELHRLVGAGTMAGLLPAEEVLARSTPTSIPGLSIMSPDDRACHLVGHAARHGEAVTLRAWIDWVRLARLCSQVDTQKRMAEHNFEGKLDEFNQVASFLERGIPAQRLGSEIVQGALSAFGDAPTRQRRSVVELIAARLRAIVISERYRKHIASEMRSWQWWRRVCLMLRKHD